MDPDGHDIHLQDLILELRHQMSIAIHPVSDN